MHSANLTVLYKMIMYTTVSFCNSIYVSWCECTVVVFPVKLHYPKLV